MSKHAGRLSVDFIVCDGLGYCAKELPRHIRLDDWGYPILNDDAVSEGDLKRAKKAVRSCPVEALRLELEDGREGVARDEHEHVAADQVDPRRSFKNLRRQSGAERSRV